MIPEDNYISTEELEIYLWRFIRLFLPHASGRLDKYLPVIIEMLEEQAYSQAYLAKPRVP